MNEVNSSPYWWVAAPRPEDGAPRLPASADVVVIGSGYTGLSAALTLARAGREVLVVERDRPGEGASSRNAGMMSGNLKHSYVALKARLGEARARTLYAEGNDARTYVHALIDDEGIDCDRHPSGRIIPAMTPRHYAAMARDADEIREAIGVETYGVPRGEQSGEIGSDLYHGVVVNEAVWSFHPGKYHSALLDLAVKAGATLAARTEVSAIERRGEGFAVHTARGTVGARDVVLATNGYTPPGLGWWRRRVVPVSSQMVVTAPIGDNLMRKILPTGRVVVESSNLFHYFRPTPDGSRLMAGGRYGGGRAGLAPGVATIRAHLEKVFPDLGEVDIEHTWDGYTAFTRDFLPHTGVRDGVHYAMGFCGSGTVWGTWLGHKTALRILGDPDAASAFEVPLPTIPFYTGNPWFLRPAMGWYALRDRMGW